MATDTEIEQALATVAATANDHQLERFEPARVQELVTAALDGHPRLTVDKGGGLHDETGTRIGIVRRTDSGEWITERQNPEAVNADAEVPSPPRTGMLARVLRKFRGSRGSGH